MSYTKTAIGVKMVIVRSLLPPACLSWKMAWERMAPRELFHLSNVTYVWLQSTLQWHSQNVSSFQNPLWLYFSYLFLALLWHSVSLKVKEHLWECVSPKYKEMHHESKLFAFIHLELSTAWSWGSRAYMEDTFRDDRAKSKLLADHSMQHPSALHGREKGLFFKGQRTDSGSHSKRTGNMQ